MKPADIAWAAVSAVLIFVALVYSASLFPATKMGFVWSAFLFAAADGLSSIALRKWSKTPRRIWALVILQVLCAVAMIVMLGAAVVAPR